MEIIGEKLLQFTSPILEFIAPIVPGNTFPSYFEIELFQRALISAILVTIIAAISTISLVEILCVNFEMEE